MERVEVKDVFARFGVLHGLQVMGFCLLWNSIGRPNLEMLRRDVQEKLGEAGLKRAAAFKYVKQMKAWNADLGRDPDQVEELLEQVWELGAGALRELEPEKSPQPKTIVL